MPQSKVFQREIKMTDTQLEKELTDFIKAHYYSDVDDGILWEPFENYDEAQIEEWIENDVDSLKSFITNISKETF